MDATVLLLMIAPVSSLGKKEYLEKELGSGSLQLLSSIKHLMDPQALVSPRCACCYADSCAVVQPWQADRLKVFSSDDIHSTYHLDIMLQLLICSCTAAL